MAGAQEQFVRRVNPYCKYRMFHSRLEGKIPCLGLGSNFIADVGTPDQGTITGLAFQKVDHGVIRPALPIADFKDVVWTNSPLITRNDRIKTVIDLNADALPQQIPKEWTIFTNLMSNLYQLFLAELNNQLLADQQQTRVYEALRKLDPCSPDLLEIRHTVIQGLANLNLAQPCRDFSELVDNFMSGFIQDAGGVSTAFFKLFHDPLSDILNFKVAQSPRSSSSRSSHEGAVHCLTYSATSDQPEVLASEAEARRSSQPVRGRLRYKILNRKRTGSRSSSRESSESSESPENGGIENYCENTTQAPDQPALTLEDVLNDLDNVEISTLHHHSFVEPHNSDLYVSKVVKTQNQRTTKVVLVVEVASYEKPWGNGSSRFDSYIEDNVEQLIQEILAAISCHQTCISGMLIVPDGIVLVEVQFENNAYIVKETDLIIWNQNNELLHALNYISQKLNA